MRTRSLLPALALAVLGAACSEGRIATELPFGADGGGAVVLGTVVREPSSSGAGITVHAEGTGSATATDETGKFVLGGLPSGTVTLRFRGADCDAALEVSGLVSGGAVTIRVRVAGSQATLQS
jgi:carboxypeptidase-like protein